MQDNQIFKLTYDVLDEILKQRKMMTDRMVEVNHFDDEDIDLFPKLFAITDDTVIKVLSIAITERDNDVISDKIMEVMNKFMKNKLDSV